MKSNANGTASKWAGYKPRWDGDLISNTGLYYPVPKDPSNPDDYWKTTLAHAEQFMHDSSRNIHGYAVSGHKIAMCYYAASSGYHLYELASRFPEMILDNSLRMAPDGDDPHMTIQAAGRVLDPENMHADGFMRNYSHAETDVATAAHSMPDTYLIAPHHRETILRALKDIYPMTFGAGYEDSVFEIHKWGPDMLHNYNKGVHLRDHQWSRNAVPEEQLAAAVQFGKSEPLQIRHGMNYDVTDLRNRPISLLDRAWEVARHILDVTTWNVDGTGKYEGKQFQFRTDPAVAYLATLFMYDEMFRSDEYKAFDREWAHPVVKDFYADDNAQEQWWFLKEAMLPYIAAHCNTKTLHNILEQDSALSGYWNDVVLPHKDREQKLEEVIPAILGYVPRGGFDHKNLRDKAAQYAAKANDKSFKVTWADDPREVLKTSYKNAPSVPLGLRGAHSFDASRDPSLFNDRNFAQLGNTSNPQADPNPDQYNRAQLAAVQMISGFRETGVRPANAPRKFMYLDDPKNGYRAEKFRFGEGRKINDPRQMSATFDSHAEGGQSYAKKYAPETMEEFVNQQRAMIADPHFAEWREEHGFGNVIGISDLVESGKMKEGIRESLNTEMYDSIAASGPMRVASSVIETVARRLIDMEMDGIVIPAGDLSPQSWRLIGESLIAATGMAPRDYSGGDYSHEIFLDRDYDKPLDERGMPQKMDVADLLIHLTGKYKAVMEGKNPPLLRDETVTLARVADIYERIIDPARCNVEHDADPRSGKPARRAVIDFSQVDPHLKQFAQYDPGLVDSYESYVADPAYQRFFKGEMGAEEMADMCADPVSKAELAKMCWFWLRKQRLPGAEQEPVEGMLLLRGIHAMDKFDLRDLPPEYEAAFERREKLTAYQGMNIIEAGRKHIKGPSVSKP